jgi:serine/threonine-protein kinase
VQQAAAPPEPGAAQPSSSAIWSGSWSPADPMADTCVGSAEPAGDDTLEDLLARAAAAAREAAQGESSSGSRASDRRRIGRIRTAPTIAGYETLGELGRGGVGVVYLARRTLLNRPCALKMILAGAYADADTALRFLAEAEAVARLEHPNIVRIHHVGEYEGLPFLELEFIPGGNLSQALDGRPWPPRRAIEFIEPLARAIASAHARGMVHRDLKPSNILMGDEGVPKLTDFGLVKSLTCGGDLTCTEAILGSPSYMAPEQAEGHSRDVGPLADVYALGTILYELLTGRPTFKADTIMETLDQVRTAEPVRPSRIVSNVPRDAETICLKCLEKDPARRYPSALAFAEDLRRFLLGEPVLARRSNAWEKVLKWVRRRPVVAGLVIALTVSLVVLFCVAAWAEIRIQRARATIEIESRARRAAEAALARLRTEADGPRDGR